MTYTTTHFTFAQKLLLNILVLVVVLQIGSILTNKLFGISVLKLGFAILLIILASVMAVIINASFQFGGFKKEDFLMIVFLVGLGVALYFFLPQYYPDIFSAVGGRGIFSTLNP